MTRQEILQEYYSLLEKALGELNPRLLRLMEQERITAEAVYYQHNRLQWPGSVKITSIIDRGLKSKDFEKYLNRVKKSELLEALNSMRESFFSTQAFIDEQESLPFEECQSKQMDNDPRGIEPRIHHL